MMKQLHTFDDIFDTQKTFRLLLDAMANPSRVVSIQEGEKRHFGKSPYFRNTHHWMQRRKKCVLQHFRPRCGWSGNIPESGGIGRSLSFADRTGI